VDDILFNLKNKKILVTGPRFLGKYIVEQLNSIGANVGQIHHKDCDICDYVSVDLQFQNAMPEYVIHCAGVSGNLKFQEENAAYIYNNNVAMGNHIFKCCVKYKVDKLVNIVTSCAYPENDEQYLKEHTFLQGEPNRGVSPHGYAKRHLQVLSRFYRQQYGLRAVCLCPTGLIGPGDSFDLTKTKVSASLIKKICIAKSKGAPVEAWGTGETLREFVDVRVVAHEILKALVLYNDSEIPLNIGSGNEVSIKQLAELIAKIADYKGEIKWSGKDSGQKRKLLDMTRQRQILGVPQDKALSVSVLDTIRYYRENHLYNDTR
jgi:GDP-L-fucose synthase